MDKDKGSRIIYVDFDRIEKHKKYLLSIPRDKQLEVLRLAYNKGIDTWFETQRIFDEPVAAGGIETDVIEKLFEELILNDTHRNMFYGNEVD